MSKGFKTQTLGEMTPEVLLAQASEIQWRGLMVIGFIKTENPEEFKIAFNTCKLTRFEFQWLVRYLEAQSRA